MAHGRSILAVVLVLLAGLALCGPGDLSARGGEAAAAAPVPVVNSIGLKLVTIPAGEFEMGSPAGEPGHVANESPVHRVRITRAFEMGVHEVTNGQFEAFVGATGYRTEAERDVEGGFGIDFETATVIQDPDTDWKNPGFPGFRPGPDHPVLMVSWADAEAFCRWLSAEEGRTYRLPTEAEWEYACRAGTATPFAFGGHGADFSAFANVADRTIAEFALDTYIRVSLIARPNRYDDRVPHEAADDGGFIAADVGGYRANPWGLHDMHGNVSEWTSSPYGPYPSAGGAGDDGDRPDSARRVARGGSWRDRLRRCRSSYRLPYEPWQKVFDVGFRVVMEADDGDLHARR
jgi:formylglycine-generating enzyme required for sulfatase activity